MPCILNLKFKPHTLAWINFSWISFIIVVMVLEGMDPFSLSYPNASNLFNINHMHSKITMNPLTEEGKTEVYHAEEKLGGPIF